ncbi:hypothetical protein GCM10025734_79620 [Kitasatospora paranensis]
MTCGVPGGCTVTGAHLPWWRRVASRTRVIRAHDSRADHSEVTMTAVPVDPVPTRLPAPDGCG